MQYMIMILIVIGLAVSDFITGWIKAFCTNTINSQTMRKGGLNKFGEIVVMITVCGLEVGIRALGQYYQAAALADVAGTMTAVMVFVYITVMELISILENYAAINPEAKWPSRLIQRLKNANDTEHAKEEKNSGPS